MSYGLVFVALNPACCVERFTIHCGLFTQLWQWSIYYIYHTHSCQPLLGVNLSPEFVNLYFPYACQGLFCFCWWQWHFEFQPACVALERRSNVVLNMHAQLQISLSLRFLSLLPKASQCAFGDVVCWLLIRQFFNLFAQFKTSHKNYVFLYPFSNNYSHIPRK